MIRSRLVQLAALVMVFAVGPARAAEPPLEGKPDDTKRIMDTLGRIEQRLNVMDARIDTTLDLSKDMKQMREDVVRLQREVAELRRASAGNSTSNYPSQPSTSGSVAPPAALGRVRLVNSYMTEMTAAINGQLVTVPPGVARDVFAPAGTITYQVYQVQQPLKTTSLAANEILTLTLFPM